MVDGRQWVVVEYGGQLLNCGQYNILKIILSVSTLNDLTMSLSDGSENCRLQICKHNW